MGVELALARSIPLITVPDAEGTDPTAATRMLPEIRRLHRQKTDQLLLQG